MTTTIDHKEVAIWSKLIQQGYSACDIARAVYYDDRTIRRHLRKYRYSTKKDKSKVREDYIKMKGE